MKQIRLDFSGGVNVITDKSVIPDKFGTVMDNIDLRSSFPRCFKEPIFQQIVSESTTKKIFNYRGRWIYSDNWRDYVADFINGIERIYWSENINELESTSEYTLAPQKMIEGTQVPLGTPRPTSKLIASSAKSIVPNITAVTLINDGSMTAGTYYYAVSAIFPKGITSPSNILSATIAAVVSPTPPNYQDIKIQWSLVSDAIGYVVYGRANSYSEMREIYRTNGSTNVYVDNGSITPKGDNPAQFFDNSPVAYVYTYERDVNSATDESGLSPISDTIKTVSGRGITRDYLNDGFLNQTTSVNIDTDDGYTFTVEPRPSTVDTFPYYEDIEINSWTYNDFTNQVDFTSDVAHKLTTGDKIVFTGSAWLNPEYNNQEREVIVISSTVFAISNIVQPTDMFNGVLETNGVTLSENASCQGGEVGPFPIYRSSNDAVTDAEMDLTFTGNFAYSIDTYSVTTIGTDTFDVGDEIYVLLEPVPYQGQATPETIQEGSSTLATPPVTITNAGSGFYTTGSIKDFYFTDSGSGYTAGTYTSQALTGGTGTSATIDCVVDSTGLVSNVVIVNTGKDYVVGDTLTASITGGSDFEIEITDVYDGSFQNVELTTLTGSGTGAFGNVYIDGSGTIYAIEITDGGTGYAATDTITYGSGGGSGAVITVDILANTKVKAKFIVNDVNGNNEVSIARSRITISPTPSEGTINNGDVMYLNMSDSSIGLIGQIKILSGGNSYTNGTYSTVNLSDGLGGGATATITVSSGVVSSVVMEDYGTGYEVNDILTVDPNDVGGTGVGFQLGVVTILSGNSIQGLYKVRTTDLDGDAIPEGSFDIDKYVGVWTEPTELGASARWTPYNGYYKTWNLYRTGVTGSFQLVEKVDLEDYIYLDKISTAYLGVPPTSYYEDAGIFGTQQIDFNTPPLGLQSLTFHYGMLFGVDNQRVKWTPVGQPDAWPDVYYYDFSYKPLALASFGTGLIVLCEDAIYRIDGNQSSSMSLSKTNANEGCIAPYSVQKTNRGLIYLSKRGLMIFDGMNAQCITDQSIPSRMLISPSKLDNPINFWWIPTKLGFLYGNFAYNDGVYYPDTSANKFYLTNPIPSAIYDIKSFYHLGRYYLVYTGTTTYEAHTTLCIDLQLESMPITTLGLKPVDVIVNELDDAYVLLDNQGNGNMDNLNMFKTQQSLSEPFIASETYTISSPYTVTVDNSATFVINQSVYNSSLSIPMVEVASNPSANEYSVSSGVYTFNAANNNNQIIIKYQFGFETNAGLSVWKLFGGIQNIPLVIRSGQKSIGPLTERKKYSHLEFYGNGSLYVRCYIDTNWIADDFVSLTELPTKERKFNIPKGLRTGYNLDFEAYGDSNRLVVEYGYSDLTSPS